MKEHREGRAPEGPPEREATQPGTDTGGEVLETSPWGDGRLRGPIEEVETVGDMIRRMAGL